MRKRLAVFFAYSAGVVSLYLFGMAAFPRFPQAGSLTMDASVPIGDGERAPLRERGPEMFADELFSMQAEILDGVAKESSHYACSSAEAARIWDTLVAELFEVAASA
ncbi:hypothetical protein [Marmoricola sp. RAF53]|uniref:hypothetical protein n=1 Tax=Marmoricola sp. RAF53 TaxID=3233059 RepID=UPI003F97105B